MRTPSRKPTILPAAGPIVYPVYGGGLSGPDASFAFDGSTKLYLPTFNLPNFTIEAWIKPSTLSGPGSAGVLRFVAKYPGSGSASGGVLLDSYKGSAGSVQDGFRVLYFATSAHYATAGAGTLSVDTWQHIAGSYDGSTIRAIVNGVQVASTSIAGSVPTSSQPWSVAEDDPTGADSEWFSGLMTELRFWSVGKTAAEVSAVMNSRADGSEANLEALLPMQGNHLDYGPNGYAVTIGAGTEAYSADSPF